MASAAVRASATSTIDVLCANRTRAWMVGGWRGCASVGVRIVWRATLQVSLGAYRRGTESALCTFLGVTASRVVAAGGGKPPLMPFAIV